jgi:2-oxoglutarate dehydrogenase E1 component
MESRSRVDVVLPELGLPSVRVSVWYANPGDHVYQGDRLIEVVTEGATFDVPAPVTGELIAQHVFPRDELRAGQVLGAVLADLE